MRPIGKEVIAECCRTPFGYPDRKHVRQERPGQYRRNSAFKPYLKREFGGRCVYCRKPDSMSERQIEFGVDHYLPAKHFPELAFEYKNLLYACNTCNSYKGDYFAKKGQPRVVNPCLHALAKHLRFKDMRVETRTKNGKLTEELLLLNDQERIEYRADLSRLVDGLRSLLRDLVDDGIAYLAYQENGGSPTPDKSHELRIDDVNHQYRKVRIQLNRLTGCNCAQSMRNLQEMLTVSP